jgi:molybdopterin-binding protein
VKDAAGNHHVQDHRGVATSNRSGSETTIGGSVAVMRLSARNQLDGTVVRVEHGAVMSTVVIRLAGGQEVVSVITKDSATDLGLAEGDAVKAVIKSTEVMVGKD